jgi:hypothetical protein
MQGVKPPDLWCLERHLTQHRKEIDRGYGYRPRGVGSMSAIACLQQLRGA